MQWSVSASLNAPQEIAAAQRKSVLDAQRAIDLPRAGVARPHDAVDALPGRPQRLVDGPGVHFDRLLGFHQPHYDVQRMRAADVHAFLVGEAFMRADDPGVALAALFA